MSNPWRILLVLILLGAGFGLRAPFLQHPIWNIDEGVTFTVAEQLRHGAVIYRDAADHRNPLVPYLQAAILAIAGDWNAAAIHLSLALALGLGAIGLWRLCRRLGDEAVGWAAAAFCTVLCFLLPDMADTMAAHTEWYLILFAIAAFWSLSTALPRPGFAGGLGPGALFGLALLCKQPGLLDFGTAVVLVSLLALARPGERTAHGRLLLGLGAGLVLVLGLALAYFAWHGALRDLAYYAWTYNSRIYVPEIPLPQRLLSVRDPFRLAWQHVPVAFGLGLCGALLLLASAARDLSRRPWKFSLLPWLALGWTATGIVAPALSGRGFSHYSIQIIPGLSLVCGWTVVQLWRWCAARSRIWSWAAASLLALGLTHTGGRLVHRYRETAQRPAQREALAEVFRAVRTHTRPEERIFVWGFAPEIHFLSQRLPNTRFLYSNFLTGFIPWTNIDPLKDTTYAITPQSWAQLQEDFARTPAALIVDTGDLRGNLKYPLKERSWLWQLVTREYAEVAPTAGREFRIHLYRRLPPADGHALPAHTSRDDTLRLTLDATNELQPVITVALETPAGTTLIELFLNGRLFRTLAPPPEATELLFFAPRADLAPGSNVFQAVVHRAGTTRSSPPVSIVLASDTEGAGPRLGPPLLYGDRPIQPEAVSSNHQPVMNVDHDGHWYAHAPSWITYGLEPRTQALVFSYGLEPASYDGSSIGRTDGVEITVTGETNDGATATLFRRTLDPVKVDTDRGRQTSRIELAPTFPRRVTIAIGPGGRNNYAFDWAYLADLHTTGTGPDLVLGPNRRLLPVLLAPEGSTPARDPATGVWLPNVPSQLVYSCPRDLHTVTFGFGLADTAIVDPAPRRHSDGIDIRVLLVAPDGERRPLYQRRLQPLANPADRGLQTATVELPEAAEGQLVFELTAGPAGNTDCDWGYWGDLRGTLRP